MNTFQARIQASLGHRKSSRHPAIIPYLRAPTGAPIDIFDPISTHLSLEAARKTLRNLRARGAQLLWVGGSSTQGLLKALHIATGEPVIHSRWPGGLLTNFDHVSRSARGALEGLRKMPDAIILLSSNANTIALAEARKCDVMVIGVVDSNMDPTKVDIPVFGNDDANTAIAYYLNFIN